MNEDQFSDKKRFKRFIDYLVEITDTTNQSKIKYGKFELANTTAKLKTLLKDNDVFVTQKECQSILDARNQYERNKLGGAGAY